MTNFMDGGSPQTSERVNIYPKTLTEADFQFTGKASFLKNSHFRFFHVHFCFILKPKSGKNCLKKIGKDQKLFFRQTPPNASKRSQMCPQSL